MIFYNTFLVSASHVTLFVSLVTPNSSGDDNNNYYYTYILFSDAVAWLRYALIMWVPASHGTHQEGVLALQSHHAFLHPLYFLPVLPVVTMYLLVQV